MSQLTKDQIVTHQHARLFRQDGGARPTNRMRYSGVDDQKMALTSVSAPVSGGINPIQIGDPRRRKAYINVGRTVDPPDFDSATLSVYEDHGQLPWQLIQGECPFNLYRTVGTCKDPSSFLDGVTDYLEIYSDCEVTDRSLGDRVAFDTDDAVVDELSLTVTGGIYPVGALGFGEKAATQVTVEVIDITYGDRFQCADCGVPNDGTEWIYAAAKYNTPSASNGEVIYSTDGGATWTETAVTAEDPVAIGIAGDKLVVITGTSLYWADINEKTGVPGTFTTVTPSSWAANNATDAYFGGPREVYVCGQNGYIWLFTDVTTAPDILDAGSATSNNLARIDGTDNVIVASGASGTVIISTNNGETFAATSATPSADNQQALAVFDENYIWTGTDGGEIYYTIDGGETWTEKTFGGSGSGNVYDLVAATSEVIYFSYATTDPTAQIYWSVNGGRDITRSGWRILNLPTFDYGYRIAVPQAAIPGVAANNIAIAGLAGDGADGIIVQGIAAVRGG
jgi:hypothetical protein